MGNVLAEKTVAGASLGVLIGGALAMIDLWNAHPHVHFFLAIMVCQTAFLTLIATWALGRTAVVRRMYGLGYRHGRRDANDQMLDDGLWLTNRAEQRADRLPERPDEDGL